jgi:hypothetical protein
MLIKRSISFELLHCTGRGYVKDEGRVSLRYGYTSSLVGGLDMTHLISESVFITSIFIGVAEFQVFFSKPLYQDGL